MFRPLSASPRVVICPSLGWAPSATTTMLYPLPAAKRFSIRYFTISTLYGISGIRHTSAPPESALCSAIHPAPRPITSTIMTRLWLSAVVTKWISHRRIPARESLPIVHLPGLCAPEYRQPPWLATAEDSLCLWSKGWCPLVHESALLSRWSIRKAQGARVECQKRFNTTIYLPSTNLSCALNDSTDHGVETWTISSTGYYQ